MSVLGMTWMPRALHAAIVDGTAMYKGTSDDDHLHALCPRHIDIDQDSAVSNMEFYGKTHSLLSSNSLARDTHKPDELNETSSQSNESTPSSPLESPSQKTSGSSTVQPSPPSENNDDIQTGIVRSRKEEISAQPVSTWSR